MKKFMITLLVVISFMRIMPSYADDELKGTISSSERLRPTISVKCFPETCQVGDTIYLILEASNPHKENIKLVYFISPFLNNIHIDFVDSEKKVIPFWFDVHHVKVLNVAPKTLLLRPNESQIIWRHSITVPPLEDLYGQEYWRDLLKNFPKDGQSFQIKVSTTLLHFKEYEYTSQFKIVLKQRTKNELEIFDQWYQNTPKELFPFVETIDNSIPFKLKTGEKYYKALYKLPNIDYLFLRDGNRYPGYPNLPNDWQGWKKLEESFESSTLRDEIRWTRICIQYCSTGDEKVLDELKTWLEKMNPIQRTVMVNNYFRYNENLPNSKKLYETIQSFKDKK